MSVKVIPLQLKMADDVLPQVAAIVKDLLINQLSQGIDGNGKQHTDPEGRPWDFRDSGYLLDSLVVSWKDGKLTIVFAPEYAKHVATGAPLSLSPQSRQVLAERIAPILKKGITNGRRA